MIVAQKKRIFERLEKRRIGESGRQIDGGAGGGIEDSDGRNPLLIASEKAEEKDEQEEEEESRGRADYGRSVDGYDHRNACRLLGSGPERGDAL